MPWIAVADVEDIGEEDVLEVSVGDRVLAVYHAEDGFFVTDGICTHEHAHLAEGFVFGNIIECPKHQGRFDVRTGECKGSPVSVPVRTYPTRIVDGTIEADLGDA
jgi:3-phenylpropionate/trans-cinnamate dioxygenase ferredoxin subunit